MFQSKSCVVPQRQYRSRKLCIEQCEDRRMLSGIKMADVVLLVDESLSPTDEGVAIQEVWLEEMIVNLESSLMSQGIGDLTPGEEEDYNRYGLIGFGNSPYNPYYGGAEAHSHVVPHDPDDGTPYTDVLFGTASQMAEGNSAIDGLICEEQQSS